MLCILTISPSEKPGQFNAFAFGELICTSDTPFFVAARLLLSRKLSDPKDWLVMRHAGSNHDALRSRVGYASKWTIEESASAGRMRRRIYKPRKWWEGRPRIEQNEGAATPVAERA